jgi:hypothetical protein
MRRRTVRGGIRGEENEKEAKGEKNEGGQKIIRST